MSYVITAERYGLEQGLEQGRAEGVAEGQLRGLLTGLGAILDLKFGAAGAEVLPMLRQIYDADRLETILQQIKTAISLDEVRAFAQQGD